MSYVASCGQCQRYPSWKTPLGKGTFVPFSQGKPQQPQWVNSEQHEHYRLHKSGLIHVNGSGPRRGIGYIVHSTAMSAPLALDPSPVAHLFHTLFHQHPTPALDLPDQVGIPASAGVVTGVPVRSVGTNCFTSLLRHCSQVKHVFC